MVVTNFISASPASTEALKTANLLKGLPINAFIFGQNGTGKKSLAKYILPDAPIVDASSYEELEGALTSHKNIIITNFDKIPNYDNFKVLLDKCEVRIMALATSVFNVNIIDDLFGIKVSLPPLSERLEDVKPLCEYFLKEAKETLSIHSVSAINLNDINLSNNAHSIRRSVYMQVQLQDIKEDELMNIMQIFLQKRLGGKNDYRNFLYLFEVPLIKAGLKKFKTQLQLSDKLGLNRNTLRKKIAENKDYLQDT
ncbi:Fis family transcriptional regulator [Sulfurimonas sp. MAG313]|nr:Fis family transcriptional regulator [Sulfurimonas sp. MAG313]